MSYEININAKQINEEEKAKFGVMPKGKYKTIMCDYESKQGSKGEYLQATFQVVDGEYKNRKFFDRYFLNGSEAAVKIAHGKLSSIAMAVGVENLKNIDQLLNKPFMCSVGIEEGTGDFPDKNKFNGADKLSSGAIPPKPAKAPEAAPGVDVFEDDLLF